MEGSWFSSGTNAVCAHTEKQLGLSGSLPDFQLAGAARKHNQRMLKAEEKDGPTSPTPSVPLRAAEEGGRQIGAMTF